MSRAVTLARELLAILGELRVPRKKERPTIPPHMLEKVAKRICLLCGDLVPKDKPYRRGRCAPDYQQFINDRVDDPGLEKRLIAAGTLLEKGTKMGRPRRSMPTAAELSAKDGKGLSGEESTEDANRVVENLPHKKKPKGKG